MNNRSYYAIIPANVRYDKDLKPNAKLLYGEITALCNEKGYCWATNNYFAELYSVSKETISRWISQLNKKGYITTKIIYGNDNRTILERRLYIGCINFNNYPIDEKINTYCQNNHYPIDEKINTPIDEKVKDNNTNTNNTINNTINTTQLIVSSGNNVLDLENKNLIETYTHLKLSNNMIKQVTKWDYVRLGLAIKIFIQKEGKYFAMLKKIYEDDGNFAQKNTTSTFEDGINPKSFNNFPARDYDYDDLEKKLLGWDK